MLLPWVRLVFVVILLACQLLFFAFEVFWVIKHPDRYTWTLKRFQSIALTIAVLGLAFAIVNWVILKSAQKGINSNCTVSVDGDVGGIGIRIAFWMQEGVLFLAAFTGLFHTRLTAAKEVGAGLLVTQTSFGIALLVQMIQETLSPADCAVGLMILDALNTALSIQLFMKRPLSSRWQVCTVLPAQLLGLVIIGLLIVQFNKGRLTAQDCTCFTFFWWAWLSSCSPVSSFEVPTFWMYYGFRCLSFAHNCCFGLSYIWDFDLCEKSQSVQEYLSDKRLEDVSDRTLFEQLDKSDERYRLGGRSRRRLVKHLQVWVNDDKALYWAGRNTTSNVYFIMNAVFAMTSMAAAEITLRDYGHQSEQTFTVGQITGLVIAGATGIREGWIFTMMFLKRNNPPTE
jgi:hypothetical protein